MKLVQQMLVAPAALGLLASGANAAELNINGVSDYAASADKELFTYFIHCSPRSLQDIPLQRNKSKGRRLVLRTIRQHVIQYIFNGR